MRTAAEIVSDLGGTNEAARFFGVKPPSVTDWVKKGEIPDDRLVRKAAKLEERLPGKFSRRTQWPQEFAEIWPELERRGTGQLHPMRRSTDIATAAPAAGA